MRLKLAPFCTCSNYTKYWLIVTIFSELELSLYMLSPVRLSSVCRLLSVTFVRPTQAVHIFGNISTPLGTLAIR